MKKTPKSKPGPKEQLHSLAPLTFQQALGAMLKAKPSKPTKEKKPAKRKSR